MSSIKINDEFEATQTGQEFKLVAIIEKDKGKKLKDPIYEFEYTNRPGKNFTCYLSHIENSLSFNSWKKL